MIEKLYIFESDSFDPYLNIATEKCLFDSCPENALILYLWQNENTVVIGRNQNPWNECRCRELEADGGHLARRLSGGGAVFHDIGNLNFTFICHSENYDLARQMSVIAEACKKADIETTLSGRNDILADGRKFSGNAFYNSKGRSYHHGTLLINSDGEKIANYLTPSLKKLNAKGVSSVRSRVVNLSELSPALTVKKMKEYMSQAAAELYCLNAEAFPLPDTEKVTEYRALYSSDEWKYGSTLPFSASFDERFDWGQIELRLQVEKGIVSAVQVFTDSMDHTLADSIKTALLNSEFEKTVIQKQLSHIPFADDILTLFKEI